jgi:uncharacterized protein HemX
LFGYKGFLFRTKNRIDRSIQPFKVRSQIVKEISAVKKVQVADVVGIYSQLEMLEEDVAKLGVNILHRQPASHFVSFLAGVGYAGLTLLSVQSC